MRSFFRRGAASFPNEGDRLGQAGKKSQQGQEDEWRAVEEKVISGV